MNMPERIRNVTDFVLICFLCVVLMQVGCDDRSIDGSRHVSGRQLEKESDQASDEFDVELERRMQQTETMLEPYRKNGLVKVTVEPSDGEIYVDGGLVSIPGKGLMLPIGTYTIKGLWPDGSEISKKVFVTPALQQVISWKWSSSRNVSGGSGSKKSDINFDAPLSPTNVVLTKPGS
jgi:hypothetical protein